MTTAEEVTMNRPHFRLRVDLSKFYDDTRRFCWIFVDRTKIQQVIHMKQHISKLFNIAEPFDLLLNDTEYLPPTEDVRILEKNETILVVPGLGINNKVPAIVGTSNGLICDTQAQTRNVQTEKITQGDTTRDMTFYSVDQVDHRNTNSKTINNNLTESCIRIDSNILLANLQTVASTISVTKKRKRKRKRRNRSHLVSLVPTDEENISTKRIKIEDTKNT